jgi:trimeric autotransporter adhesin
MTVVHVPADQVLAVPGPCKVDLQGMGASAMPVATAMPVPTVGSISPTGAVHGAAATSLTLTGTNYNAGTKILWGGSPVDTIYISATQVRTTLTPAQLATAGTIVVKARNGSVDSAAGQNFVIT